MRPYINFSSCSETGPCTGSVGYFGQWYPWDPATPCHYPELRLHVIGALRGIGKQNASSCLMSPSPQPILNFPSLIFWVQLSRQLVSTKSFRKYADWLNLEFRCRSWIFLPSKNTCLFASWRTSFVSLVQSTTSLFSFQTFVFFFLTETNCSPTHRVFSPRVLPCSCWPKAVEFRATDGRGGLAFLALQTQTISQLQPGSQTWLQKSADSLKPLVPLMSSP